MARQPRGGWLVRIDPNLWIDERFARNLSPGARYTYIDSLLALAGADGPEGTYPLSTLAEAADSEAEAIAAQLVAFGIWTPVDGGYKVKPYGGCGVVPAPETGL
jgi:hypothetical protein